MTSLLPLPPDCNKKNRPMLLLPSPPLVVAPAQALSELEAGESTCYSCPDKVLLDSIRPVNCGVADRPSSCDDSSSSAAAAEDANLRPLGTQPSLLLPPGPPCCFGNTPSRTTTQQAWLLRLLAVARYVRLALGTVMTLVAAAVATLIAFWSLFPVCTSCGRVVGGSSSALETTNQAAAADVGGVTPYSTLRINQLQVRRGAELCAAAAVVALSWSVSPSFSCICYSPVF